MRIRLSRETLATRFGICGGKRRLHDSTDPKGSVKPERYEERAPLIRPEPQLLMTCCTCHRAVRSSHDRWLSRQP